jgi:hypothetical protein
MKIMHLMLLQLITVIYSENHEAAEGMFCFYSALRPTERPKEAFYSTFTGFMSLNFKQSNCGIGKARFIDAEVGKHVLLTFVNRT